MIMILKRKNVSIYWGFEGVVFDEEIFMKKI